MAVTAAYGQGHVLFSNYLTAQQNQIVWSDNASLAPSGKADQALTSGDGLQFQLFFGEGTLSDSSTLTAGQIFSLFGPADSYTPPGSTHGPGGMFFDVTQVLPSWAAGDTFTFMYKVVDGQTVNLLCGSRQQQLSLPEKPLCRWTRYLRWFCLRESCLSHRPSRCSGWGQLCS